MPRSAPFTDAERQAIIAAYPRRSIREIAADTGRSYSGIRGVLVAAGVRLRPRTRLGPDLAPLIAAHRAGRSLNDIARSFGVHQTTVRYQLINAGVTMRPAGWPKDAWKKRAA